MVQCAPGKLGTLSLRLSMVCCLVPVVFPIYISMKAVTTVSQLEGPQLQTGHDDVWVSIVGLKNRLL